MKMRPDTWQIYENIHVDGISGKFGTLVEVLPWKQFFTLEGSDERPVGIVRNISINNVTGDCKTLGAVAANPDDTVENFTISNVNVKAKNDLFRCNYPTVKLTNVLVNGKAPVIETADENVGAKLKSEKK